MDAAKKDDLEQIKQLLTLESSSDSSAEAKEKSDSLSKLILALIIAIEHNSENVIHFLIPFIVCGPKEFCSKFGEIAKDLNFPGKFKAIELLRETYQTISDDLYSYSSEDNQLASQLIALKLYANFTKNENILVDSRQYKELLTHEGSYSYKYENLLKTFKPIEKSTHDIKKTS